MRNKYEVYTITETGKETIVDLLNETLEVEYCMILNYPRLVDQLINCDNIDDEQLIRDLKRLGEDSVRHADRVIGMISLLGGEPNWRCECCERRVDISMIMSQQLEKEKIAHSLYEEAARVAEQNQVKVEGEVMSLLNNSVASLFRMKRGSELVQDIVDAGKIIRILKRQRDEELTHMKIAKNIISALNFFISNPRKDFVKVSA